MATTPGRRSSCARTSRSCRTRASSRGAGTSERSTAARRSSSPRAERSAPATRASSASGPASTGAAAVRRGEQRAALGGQAPAQRGRIAGRRGEAVELVQDEVRMVGLPQRPRRARARRPLDACALLETVGQAGALELARGAQPGQQVVGAARGQGAAQQGDEAAAERGVAGRDRALEREGDPELAEDLRQQGGVLARLAHDDRHVLGREAALADQARDVRGDELELGALAAALEQQQRVAGIGAPGRRRLEQRALERVQRGALVVLGAAPAARRARGRGP